MRRMPDSDSQPSLKAPDPSCAIIVLLPALRPFPTQLDSAAAFASSWKACRYPVLSAFPQSKPPDSTAWIVGSSTELDTALTAAQAIGQAFSDSESIVNLGVQAIAEKLTAGADLLLDSLVSLLQNSNRVQASQIATQGQSSINV